MYYKKGMDFWYLDGDNSVLHLDELEPTTFTIPSSTELYDCRL